MLGAARRPPIGGTGTINAYEDHHRQNALIRSDTSTTKKRRPDNSGSKLLTSAENQLMFEFLGPNRISLAAAVVQLLRASNGKWQHVDVGVVSLVKDYERKLYALILFNIYTGDMLWEQKLYKNFTVKDYFNCRKLLSFESDECVYGLNFSDEIEASDMKRHLEKRYEAERGQRDVRVPAKPTTTVQTPKTLYSQSSGAYSSQKFQSPGFTDVGSTPHFSVSHSNTPVASNKKMKGKDQKKKKTKISKEDIGYPTNFEHKAHLGWDTDVGFSKHVSSSEPMDESVRQLLKVAGENPEHMTRDEMAFVHSFIDKYQATPALPPPIPQPTYSQTTLSRNGQQQGQRSTGFTLAPLPQQQQSTMRSYNQNHYYQQQPQQHTYSMSDQQVAMPPPAPARDSSMYASQQRQPVPVRPPTIERPPPPVIYQQDKPTIMPNYEHIYQSPQTNSVPPAPSMSQNTSNVQVPVQTQRPGPPPPPPPMQSAKPAAKISTNAPPAPPPPPTLAPTSNSPSNNQPAPSAALSGSVNDRADLLAQIQAGTKLKHVSQPVERSGYAAGMAKTSANDRDQMMEQIKQGAQLKHVDQAEVAENRKSVSNVKDLGGIAGALARALEERRKNICISDESENSDDNDSEWDAD